MKVVSFYRFVDLEDPQGLRLSLQSLCDEKGLLGTILLAEEGVNGTLAGSREAVAAVLAWLRDTLALEEPIEARWTEAAGAPFRRMRVRSKKEIVTLGRPDIRPQRSTGRHVSPEEWNGIIENPGTLVIDTRNHYEIEVGTFPNAIDPGTDSFRQFPKFAAQLAGADKDRPLAMFCTGGILNYLEQVAEEDQRWSGECFVFDSRVAVDRDLAEGRYVQCHACRRPLSSEDLQSHDYREGVSCPRCINDLDEERAKRLEERRRQVRLAHARAEAHIDAVFPSSKTAKK